MLEMRRITWSFLIIMSNFKEKTKQNLLVLILCKGIWMFGVTES